MMFDFAGKYAVVTGAAQGIGEAIARRFVADRAAGVAILDMQDCAGLAAELDPSGGKVLPLRCDVSDRASVASAFQRISQQFGRVDFLVNNAGIIRDGMFHKMSDEDWDLVVDVDLQGAFNCTRQVVNAMRKQEYGRIVFLSSIAVYGAVGQSNYAAAKGGLIALTKVLAREERNKNITVNCVIPGAIDTALTRGMARPAPEGQNAPPMGQPRDVASLICYLCSDEAWYINGACIDINGGSR